MCIHTPAYCVSVLWFFSTKSDKVLVVFVTNTGVEHKLSLFGHLTTEDMLVVKAITSNYLRKQTSDENSGLGM